MSIYLYDTPQVGGPPVLYALLAFSGFIHPGALTHLQLFRT